MCGIAGFWNYRSRRPAEREVLRSMVAAVTHRGPDEDGHWVAGDVALGSRRLRVIDLEGGQQPMTNADGSIRVVFNGEIYNHRQLRSDLASRGYQFRSSSDTEVVALAYEEWGTACLQRFNGMFGLAIWNHRDRSLFLARDRIGIKPLYVHDGLEGVVFGSELKSVVAAPWVPVEWDLEAIDDFMTYEYVPGPTTIVRSVKKLDPGTWLLYKDGGDLTPRSSRYWSLSSSDDRVATPDAAETGIRERLAAAVERRLIADVPLGAFLSGGVDSTILVGLMAGAGSKRVRSFSLGFADPTYDERSFARLAAERFGVLSTEAVVEPDVVALAGGLADHFDEPFGDVSSFPTYMISELARRDVTVALSGDGGDELFAGYDAYRADRWARRLSWAARTPLWGPIDAFLAWMPPSRAKKGLLNRSKRFVEGLRRPQNLEHARWWVFWDLAERRALLGPRIREELHGRDPFGHYRGLLDAGRDAGFDGLQRQLYADINGYLVNDILVKVDRMSMAVSLEARTPYLDHEVVEYAMRIPAEWKLRGGDSKWILKRAFRDLLPPEILRRGKEGFSIPMKNWLRGPLRPLMLDLLGENGLAERDWFAGAEVKRLVDEHVAGRENHAHRLWCLMSLELSVRALSARAARRMKPESAAVGG